MSTERLIEDIIENKVLDQEEIEIREEIAQEAFDANIAAEIERDLLEQELNNI